MIEHHIVLLNCLAKKNIFYTAVDLLGHKMTVRIYIPAFKLFTETFSDKFTKKVLANTEITCNFYDCLQFQSILERHYSTLQCIDLNNAHRYTNYNFL